MKARKKPVVIEVMRFSPFYEHSLQEAENFVGKVWKRGNGPMPRCHIVTLEGEMEVSPGDYIIKDVNGEFYPCKPDIFEKTYEIIEE